MGTFFEKYRTNVNTFKILVVDFTVVDVFTFIMRYQYSVPSQLIVPKLGTVLVYFRERSYLTLHYAMLQTERENFLILHSGRKLSARFEKTHKKSDLNKQKNLENGDYTAGFYLRILLLYSFM